MAQALESANVLKEMAKNRYPSLLKFQDENEDETELLFIARRYSTITYGSIDGKIICKLIYPDDTINTLIESATKEVEFQNKAAVHNLGPKIYNHGFSGDSIPFAGFYEYDDKYAETQQIPFPFANPFYYIIMEYYSKKNGWKGPVYVVSEEQLDSKLSNNDLFYNFIYKLIFKAEIANILDPINHFYYHPVHGLRMIDYGRCIDCKTIGEKQSALNEMMKSLEIKDKENTAKISRMTRRNNRNRSYKRPNRNRNRSKRPNNRDRNRSPTRPSNNRNRSPTRPNNRNRSPTRPRNNTPKGYNTPKRYNTPKGYNTPKRYNTRSTKRMPGNRY